MTPRELMTVDQSSQQPQRLTPLWVISLFVSLTEVVTGVAVTQASGGVQVALTAFVIAFPLLVASAFFLILWVRPYVLYPPTEFSDRVEVGAFVRAMSNKAEVVRADVGAEAANLKEGFRLQSGVILARLEAMENSFVKFLSAQNDAAMLVRAYDAERKARAAVPVAKNTSFEQNVAYWVQVVEVTVPAAVGGRLDLSMTKAEALAKELAKSGFRTTTGAWNRNYFLNALSPDSVDTLYIIQRGNDSTLVGRLRSLLGDLLPNMPIKVITFESAMTASQGTSRADPFIGEHVNAAVAYRHAA